MAIEITGRPIIVCEGKADVAFFTHLITERGLPEFQVLSANGNSRYEDILVALTTAPGFSDLSAILVVGDNDLNPAVALQNIQLQIQSAGGYGVPAAPRVPARIAGFPTIVVLMVPWDNAIGCLETLLLQSVRSVNPELGNCVDTYATCSHVDVWNEIERSKMKLQSLTSVICRSDPTTPVSYAWSRPETIVSLTQPCFEQIVEFLQEFPALVA
jgi:hypothetical protein